MHQTAAQLFLMGTMYYAGEAGGPDTHGRWQAGGHERGKDGVRGGLRGVPAQGGGPKPREGGAAQAPDLLAIPPGQDEGARWMHEFWFMAWRPRMIPHNCCCGAAGAGAAGRQVSGHQDKSRDSGKVWVVREALRLPVVLHVSLICCRLQPASNRLPRSCTFLGRESPNHRCLQIIC